MNRTIRRALAAASASLIAGAALAMAAPAASAQLRDGQFVADRERPEAPRVNLSQSDPEAIARHEAIRELMAARLHPDLIAALNERAETPQDDRAVLDRAHRILREETGLRDLVSMYRSALYRG